MANKLREYRARIVANLRSKSVVNSFCPTGEGGGIDPSCSKEPLGLTKDQISDIEVKGLRFDLMRKEAYEEVRSLSGYKRAIEDFKPLVQALGIERAVEVTKAVSKYTSTTYGRMNNSLRAGKIPKGTEDIDSFIESGSKAQVDVVYRGVGKKFLEGNPLEVGSTFKDLAFVSTSDSKQMADHFASKKGAGVTLVIEGAKGRGVYVPEDIYSKDRGEGEILLPRGSQFKVIKREGKNVHVRLV